MRFALLLLLLFPASFALKCFIGVGNGNNNNGVYMPLPCGDGDVYCYKLDIILGGLHTVTKSCGYGVCSNNGCHDTTGGSECCCKGDLCNAAAGSSLMLSSLAAAAAWLWL